MPELDQRSAVTALGMDPIDAQIRQVFFFDTPDLALNQAGVVVRARRVQRKGDDSVVKLRPVVPAALPAKLRRSPSFGVEVDAMPGGFVCSGSLKHVLDPGHVKEHVGGTRPLRKLFSKPSSGRSSPPTRRTASSSTTSPSSARSSCSSSSSRPRDTRASSWPRCGSTRTTPASSSSPRSARRRDAFLAAAETTSFLSGRGIDLSGEQQTKTRRALEYFSGRLMA